MCGRFGLAKKIEELQTAFAALPLEVGLTPRYNIAPGQPVLGLAKSKVPGLPQWGWFHWGLVPSGAKTEPKEQGWINARCETVGQKPAFRTSFERRRCVIVADGFYEWQTQGKQKRPFLFARSNQEPFGLAAIWDRWSPGFGAPEQVTCALLTTRANPLVGQIHDRMPVILEPQAVGLWLYLTDLGQAAPLFEPYPAPKMTACEVSSSVNSPQSDRLEGYAPLVGGQQLTFSP
ncbi:MAG: hypothetical protein A2600_02750 [Candidatus Lambdaproteobacteria bacterium RIFOXYD1_FULL_56_27]|uniref:Abasic site processing protein n=1 Tax=Candidatus Lambdaproteobacteria bacterium RIFOXYD2_FULL_56_26 TaxID=1817773 RepID=A0A1F6H321_9PROT|nr:MAG: hypothetical protein A2557_06815 [Candidatus Lambdaproteobacteria bacterium RIFOXYD2_FULL_56_26]OGH05317.1 MAG: hypothetical protein A2426_05140 [Candidatus Lambdaproteobacteria bacterium RIFOXYC1_FULL_56_13]OGH09158.1 MAG: hypothetical protein A2600_02750 [Candidatus Lambdaproteobacteria bacterium RIFOXYD1_FULL_56_27]